MITNRVETSGKRLKGSSGTKQGSATKPAFSGSGKGRGSGSNRSRALWTNETGRCIAGPFATPPLIGRGRCTPFVTLHSPQAAYYSPLRHPATPPEGLDQSQQARGSQPTNGSPANRTHGPTPRGSRSQIISTNSMTIFPPTKFKFQPNKNITREIQYHANKRR